MKSLNYWKLRIVVCSRWLGSVVFSSVLCIYADYRSIYEPNILAPRMVMRAPTTVPATPIHADMRCQNAASTIALRSHSRWANMRNPLLSLVNSDS
jgi:hypothetical protein